MTEQEWLCFSFFLPFLFDVLISFPKGDSQFIEELLENDTIVTEIKQLLLKHQGRKNYNFVERKDIIEDSIVIDLPKNSKNITQMTKFEVRRCVTIYLQKLGFGIKLVVQKSMVDLQHHYGGQVFKSGILIGQIFKDLLEQR